MWTPSGPSSHRFRSPARGYTSKSRFSFNVAGGRCEACSGAGVKTIEMQFLSDVEVPCDVCEGRRFNAETLDIRYRGKTIHDVLEMTISEASEFFARHKKIRRVLDTLNSVGLGYISLGQTSTTLSGGEAQRIKLATELHRPATGRTLYLLDEPTTGLHMADIERLLAALQALVDHGNTVAVIEHNADVIKVADHIIDMGPEGGEAGGFLVGSGTPEEIAKLDTATGAVLRDALGEALPIRSPDPEVVAASTHHKDIRLKGTRTHNIKGIDVTFPHGKMTVVTGVSRFQAPRSPSTPSSLRGSVATSRASRHTRDDSSVERAAHQWMKPRGSPPPSPSISATEATTPAPRSRR